MHPAKNSSPKLRFPEFVSDWKLVRLGDLFEERSEFTEEDLPLHSLTIEAGVVPKTERYERSFLVRSDDDAYKVMHQDDFAFNPMNLRFGALARYKNSERILVSKYYNIFFCNENADPVFAENYLTSYNVIQFYNKMASGTLDEKKRVHYLDFVNFKLPYPRLAEQQKIAAFISAVDERIGQLTKKEALLLKYKKGVTQQIFNQKVRFKDENGNDFPGWETVSLGDVLDYEQPTKYLISSTQYSDSYSTPVLTAGKTFILGYTNETNGVYESNLPVIIFDDFTTAFKFVNFPFKAKSSAMKILKPRAATNLRFIFEAMQRLTFVVGGHERHWISKFSCLTIDLPVPEEQQKIAGFLTALDEKITLVSQEVERVKEFKKGLLQQMFI